MNTRYLFHCSLSLILILNGAAAEPFTNALVPFRPPAVDGNSALNRLDIGPFTSRFLQV